LIRYNQSEKVEIIRLVEESKLSVRLTLAELDIPRSTLTCCTSYNWYNKFLDNGYDGLADVKPRPKRIWSRIPDSERDRVRQIALERPELTPRELAWHITDSEKYFISESSVYRILKSFDLIASPNYVVISASDKFQNPTKRVNEMWQTDFTYFKIVGWGWYYLATVLDDFSRYIVTWKLFSTMLAEDVKTLLDMAVAETGVDQVKVKHRPRLLSDTRGTRASRLSTIKWSAKSDTESARIERRLVYHLMRGLMMRIYDLISFMVPDIPKANRCRERVRFLMRSTRLECYNALNESASSQRRELITSTLASVYTADPTAATVFWIGIRAISQSIGFEKDHNDYFLGQISADLATRFNQLSTPARYASMYAMAEESLKSRPDYIVLSNEQE